MEPVHTVIVGILLLWFTAGVGDWLCHRATNIEHTSGAKESALHLVMFAELAIPILACLFLEISALVIAIMIVSFLAHEATAFWDVSYAIKRRYISPIEQHIHSFLELMPLMAGAFIAVLHWPQVLALFGLGSEPARFTLEWKEPPLPVMYKLLVLGAAVFLELLPYLEELWRTLRAHARGQTRTEAISSSKPGGAAH